MSEGVRVELREANMTDSARVRERNGQVFLAMETPPPVRSLLHVTVAPADAKAFEVTHVIEVVDEGEPERGCYGVWADSARLSEPPKVGSEHLEPGISSGGVPAPVVIMNTSEMMLAEAGEDEELVLSRSERFGAGESSGDEG